MDCVCYDTSNKCLHECERTIDQAQDLIARCSGIDTQECAQKIGELVAQIEKCLEACVNASNHCSHVIAGSHEKEIVHVARECITSCEQTIAALKQVLTICKAAKPECLEVSSRLISVCSNCAEVCRKCIAMGI